MGRARTLLFFEVIFWNQKPKTLCYSGFQGNLKTQNRREQYIELAGGW